MLKPAANFTTQFLCCVPCDFLLILALLLVLLHSAGYLGAPAPNFPNNLILWLPLTPFIGLQPLFDTLLNLVTGFLPERKAFFPGNTRQNLNPANSSWLEIINCCRLALFLSLSLPLPPIFPSSITVVILVLIPIQINSLKIVNPLKTEESTFGLLSLFYFFNFFLS